MNKGDLWWCDLSPTTGNEACGLRLCKILKILQDDLVMVLPYYPIGGNRYEPMIEHKRTISIKRLKEKWEKGKIVVCKVKRKGR